MIRGESLYASGIVLVTPLEMEVLEEPGASRVRVTLRDHKTKDFLSKVQVKVIGSENSRFISGETDLRGVFVAEGVRGVVTAVARKGSGEYAFYRGTEFVGQRAVPAPAQGGQAAPQPPGASGENQALDANIRMQNSANEVKNIRRLQERYSQPADKAKAAPAGGFR